MHVALTRGKGKSATGLIAARAPLPRLRENYKFQNGRGLNRKAPDGRRLRYQTRGLGSVWPDYAGAGTTGLDKPEAQRRHP